ncbi:DNA-binding protein SMUBP-2-like [Amphibalanus amphitrite]|uniref:DNA-binding protein SMUBP-2-like n=1 Tax=Amphibalanus amphitrite TaxID=1232801 RepID=UPI001C91D646|nr:DNA-binding protein SMUBP-2-like [Amphibalanus amphitrite]
MTDSQPDGPSGGTKKLPSSPLTCEELQRLHLQLLDWDHVAVLQRQQQLAALGQLEGLLVDRTELTPNELQLWVLRLTNRTKNGPGVPAVNGRPLRHNIRDREPIEVFSTEPEEFGVTKTAVVYKVTEDEIFIVIDNGGELIPDTIVDIKRLDDDSMHRKMRSIVRGLDGISGRARRLRAVLFGEWPVESSAELPAKLINANGRLDFHSTELNQLQRDAVEFAVRQKHLAVIHGPPGTGKTTTIVEIILQHLKMGCRILACADSNTAVDNILERLSKKNSLHNLDLRMVRLGHPARIRESLLRFSLDRVTETLGRSAGHRHGKRGRSLRKLAIETSNVVLCTLANASRDGLLGAPGRRGLGAFDLVVIDECSQSVEAACWLAAQRTGKLLLAGDYHQLPPTIISQKAACRGLEVSLMERQVKLHGAQVIRMLCTQYRMHELIQQWPSQQYYGGHLRAAPVVRHHRLTDLPRVRLTEDTEHTLVLIDTAGYGLTEARPDYSGSRSNHGEAEIVAAHVGALVHAGVPPKQIGVITPYRAQSTRVLDLLCWRYLGEVDVQTVDGFQGREKEAIIVTLVISKKQGLGFVTDKRRINVAITRARRQLVIVCDTKLMSQDKDVRSLLKYMRRYGKVWTANDYKDDLSTEVRARLRGRPRS